MGIFDRIAGQLSDLIAPDEVRERVARAESHLRAGALDEAIRELSLAVHRAPDHARAAYLLGVALARRGEDEGAVRALEQSLQLRPDLAEAHLLLAATLRKLGRDDEALERYRRALEAAPSDPALLAEAYRGRGAIHLVAGRADKAVRELRKAAAALPADGESNRLLGIALAGKGDLDGARICLEKAAAALTPPAPPPPTADEASPDPAAPPPPPPEVPAAPPGRDLAATLVALAEVHRRLKRRHDAGARLDRAFEAEPRSAAARLVRSRMFLDAGDAAAARAAAAEALAEAEAGEPAAALDPLAAHVLFDADDVLGAARLQLARAAARAGDAAAALDTYDAALDALPAERPPAAPAPIPVETSGPTPAGDTTPPAGPVPRGALAPPDAPRARLLDEAMHVALAGGLAARALALAERQIAPAILDAARTGELAPQSPADADLLGALSLGRLAAGDLDAAERLADRAASVPTLEARLAHAAVQLARGRRAAAAATLRLAAEQAPADARPRARLAAVYRAESEPGASPDLYALLVAAHRHLQKAPETSDLAPEAARVVEVLDRPLLLTVMGEFNAGKSTFVNALVGVDVAPMGITPTTATINVLKYGAERGGRVVYRDDTIRHVAWDEVGPLLRALDDAEASRIRFVEVLYPHETLQRVNIVDTPGLNSIRPEHESTAREFIASADAIIWLFSCRQAGTASEREALERIRAEGRKVLGVVNQIDLVDDEPEARAEVLAHLDRGFAELVEALIPFSAREALLGRSDPARLARSNRAELDRALAERFFDRAKAIQREVAARRLGALLDEARRRTEALVAAAASAPARLDEAARSVAAARAAALGPGLDEERRRCVDRLGDLYAQAAREVLDFVRPRRWRFGENEAEKADRDFLVALVEQQLLSLAASARARMDEATRAEAAPLHAASGPAEAAAFLEEERHRLDAEVYARYRGFVRGFLRGGRVDDFFSRALPRIDLGEQAIARALLRDMPALAVLDDELIAPLGAFLAGFFDRLEERLRRVRRADELRRLEIEERLVAPVVTMRAALAALGYDLPSNLAESPPIQPTTAPIPTDAATADLQSAILDESSAKTEPAPSTPRP